MGLVVGLEGLLLLLPMFWRVGLVAMCVMTLTAGLLTGDWVASVQSGSLSASPDVWTDGSLVRDEVSGVCSGGAGVFTFASGSGWFRRSWGHLELLPPDQDTGSERSWLFFSVPKPLQTVQRAELWGVIAATASF